MFTQLTEISGTWKLTQKCAHAYSNNECVQHGVLDVCAAVIKCDEQQMYNETVDNVENQTEVIDPDAEWVTIQLIIIYSLTHIDLPNPSIPMYNNWQHGTDKSNTHESNRDTIEIRCVQVT
jgi:hypothetical protein